MSTGRTHQRRDGGCAGHHALYLPKADGALRLGALRFHPEGVLAVASGLRGSYTVASIGF